MRVRILAVAVGLLSTLSVAFAHHAFTAEFDANQPVQLIRQGVAEKVSDHVYVIPEGRPNPNIGIIVGTRGTFVIDTGLGTRNGQAIMREVGKIRKGTELYLAPTHFHAEHDLGAMGFPADAKMLRSRDQQKEVDELGAGEISLKRKNGPLQAELLADAQFRKADIHFDQEHTIDLGGVRVRLLAMGVNHTRGDTAFFVEPDRVLFSGDVAMTILPVFPGVLGNHWYPSSTVGYWLTSLDRLEKLGPKLIVPCHGPMGDLSIITNYRTFMTTVRTRAAALKRQGKSLDETVETVATELAAKYPDRARVEGVIRIAYNGAR